MVATVEAYDPERDLWTSLGLMPVPRHGLATCVVDDRIHMIGGGPDAAWHFSAHHDLMRPHGAHFEELGSRQNQAVLRYSVLLLVILLGVCAASIMRTWKRPRSKNMR
eukprot:TRINITY_DN13231_c0_g2_i1.p2 TRINITY_DN13231_c0_g2~~TRINITY_DN13231_c0_g2_i1.p2  ORF type:complete len:108 (-),score=1.16 TRINITY_DN13231_c0_g2_i1:215-538(-)